MIVCDYSGRIWRLARARGDSWGAPQILLDESLVSISPAYARTGYGTGGLISIARDATGAVPYLAALDQILGAGLAADQSLTILAVYNLLYALPFALVPLLVAIMGDSSRPILDRINSVMVATTDKLMPILLLLLGLALIADSVKFLATGTGLW